MTSDEIVLDRLATLVHAFYDHERRDAARHVYRDVKSIIEAQTREIEKLRKDKNQAVDFLKQFASRSADFMEGASLPEFKIYEDQMCWATQTLHKLGVWFDPISGITKSVTKSGSSHE